MTGGRRQTSAGRVGRAHGLDGSFWVERPSHALAPGTRLGVAGRSTVVVYRGGTGARPLLRLDAVGDRHAAEALHGEVLLVALDESPLGEGEWLVEDLIGCSVDGIGEVRQVLAGPSCDLLEVGEDGVLVPLVSDAVSRVDIEARSIEVDRAFLGL